MAAFKSSGNLIQHLAVDRAQAVFFGEIFYANDRRHGELESLFFPFDSVLEL